MREKFADLYGVVMRHPIFLLAARATIPMPIAVQAQVRSLNQREVIEAQRPHPELVKEYGRRRNRSPRRLCRGCRAKSGCLFGSHQSGQVSHFTTLNSAVENAFAVPGRLHLHHPPV